MKILYTNNCKIDNATIDMANCFGNYLANRQFLAFAFEYGKDCPWLKLSVLPGGICNRMDMMEYIRSIMEEECF